MSFSCCGLGSRRGRLLRPPRRRCRRCRSAPANSAQRHHGAERQIPSHDSSTLLWVLDLRCAVHRAPLKRYEAKATAAMMITPCTVSSSAPETPWRLSSVKSASSVSAPGHRGEHGPAAAAEDDAAEHDRGDRLELEPCADLGGHAGEAAEQDAGDRGRQAGQHERDRPHVLARSRRTAARRARCRRRRAGAGPKSARIRKTAPAPSTSMISTDRAAARAPGSPRCPRRPNSRKLSGSAPRGAPPVHRNTAPERISSIPSVVMNDGTRRRVVIRPLTSPTRDADREQQRDHRPGLATGRRRSAARRRRRRR